MALVLHRPCLREGSQGALQPWQELEQLNSKTLLAPGASLLESKIQVQTDVHGGLVGFSRREWAVEEEENSEDGGFVKLSYQSADGEEVRHCVFDRGTINCPTVNTSQHFSPISLSSRAFLEPCMRQYCTGLPMTIVCSSRWRHQPRLQHPSI